MNLTFTTETLQKSSSTTKLILRNTSSPYDQPQTPQPIPSPNEPLSKQASPTSNSPTPTHIISPAPDSATAPSNTKASKHSLSLSSDLSLALHNSVSTTITYQQAQLQYLRTPPKLHQNFAKNDEKWLQMTQKLGMRGPAMSSTSD